MASLFLDAIDHHIWSTEVLIDACHEMTPEQLATRTHPTFGSVLETLRHLVAVDTWYLTFFPVEQPPPIDEKAETTLPELRSAIGRNRDLWHQVLAQAVDGDEEIVEHGDGWDFYSPLGFRLAQVVHHGTDHRSQIWIALTNSGVAAPDMDLWAYGEATGRTRGVYHSET
jgi:uncharacterized damage-inducible protein DinB